LPEPCFDRVITKLPLLEQLVLSYGHLLRSTMLGILQHCPRLEVLDAGECITDRSIGASAIIRWHRKLKVLRVPRVGRRDGSPRNCFFPAAWTVEEEEAEPDQAHGSWEHVNFPFD
jgi:hypothetical protein